MCLNIADSANICLFFFADLAVILYTCIGYITRWRSLRDLHTEGRRPEAV